MDVKMTCKNVVVNGRAYYKYVCEICVSIHDNLVIHDSGIL